MFTPASLRVAVIWARAPGSSGISTVKIATPARTCGLAARPTRAAFAPANEVSRSPRRSSSIASRRASSPAT